MVATWLNVVATAWVVLGSEGIFAVIDAKAMERTGAQLDLLGLLLQGLLAFAAVPLLLVTLALVFRRRADARRPLLLSGAALLAAEVAFWWMLTSFNVPINGPGPC